MNTPELPVFGAMKQGIVYNSRYAVGMNKETAHTISRVEQSLIAPKNLLFGGIHGAYVYSSMRHEVGFGERENPSASLPDETSKGEKNSRAFGVSRSPNPTSGLLRAHIISISIHHSVAGELRSG